MAGLFVLSRADDRAWSAATWMFDWVVNYVADHVGREDVANDLRLVSEANLGAVDLDEFDLPGRQAVLGILRTELVPAADQFLTEPDKESALALIRQLAAMAQVVPDHPSAPGSPPTS